MRRNRNKQMMEALGFRQTKWKRLSWNTNVTAIQLSPTLDKTCQIPRDERSNISNITPNSKDDKKPAAYDNDREKSKLNPELAICRGCLQGLSTTIPCDQSLGEKPTNSSLNCKPSPLFLSPSGIRGPRKRALLVGVTYKNWKYKLKGTVNNVKNMRDFLIDSFFFKPKNILVLTEDETEPYLTPTRKNIETSLKWLVKDCQVGDSLVFYFSGHGLRQPDFNSDELDGFDETICPVDFMKEGMIIDNYIYSTIVWPLPKGVTLHAIVDASNSSTLDLVYVYNREKRKWEDYSPPSCSRKHTNGGLAISIDFRMAADNTGFPEWRTNDDQLTYIFIEIVKKLPGVTYGDLLDSLHETIDVVNNRGSVFSRFLRSMLEGKILQKPQLSASEPFDVYKNYFIL